MFLMIYIIFCYVHNAHTIVKNCKLCIATIADHNRTWISYDVFSDQAWILSFNLYLMEIELQLDMKSFWVWEIEREKREGAKRERVREKEEYINIITKCITRYSRGKEKRGKKRGETKREVREEIELAWQKEGEFDHFSHKTQSERI